MLRNKIFYIKTAVHFFFEETPCINRIFITHLSMLYEVSGEFASNRLCGFMLIGFFQVELIFLYERKKSWRDYNSHFWNAGPVCHYGGRFLMDKIVERQTQVVCIIDRSLYNFARNR